MQFRLTRQALADLGLDVYSLRRLNADGYKTAHPVVAAFVDRRSQSPVGPEATQLPKTRAVVYNLHVDRFRGLTWHQQEADIIWLLGVGHHESRSIDDAYAVLKRRDVSGTLMPTREDFRDLEATESEQLDFLEQVSEQVPALFAAAHSAPESEVTELIAGRLVATVLVSRVSIDGEWCDEYSSALGCRQLKVPANCHLRPIGFWQFSLRSTPRHHPKSLSGTGIFLAPVRPRKQTSSSAGVTSLDVVDNGGCNTFEAALFTHR